MEMIEGDLSGRIQKLVEEWGCKYKDELMQMWKNKMLKNFRHWNNRDDIIGTHKSNFCYTVKKYEVADCF